MVEDNINWSSDEKVNLHIRDHVINVNPYNSKKIGYINEASKWKKLIDSNKLNYDLLKDNYISKTPFSNKDPLFIKYVDISKNQIDNEDCAYYLFSAKDGYSLNYINLSESLENGLLTALHYNFDWKERVTTYTINSCYYKEKIFLNPIIIYFAYYFYKTFDPDNERPDNIRVRDALIYINKNVNINGYNLSYKFEQAAIKTALQQCTANDDCLYIDSIDKKKLSRFLLVLKYYFTKKLDACKNKSKIDQINIERILIRLDYIYDSKIKENRSYLRSFSREEFGLINESLNKLEEVYLAKSDLPDFLLCETAIKLFELNNKDYNEKFIKYLRDNFDCNLLIYEGLIFLLSLE